MSLVGTSSASNVVASGFTRYKNAKAQRECQRTLSFSLCKRKRRVVSCCMKLLVDSGYFDHRAEAKR